MFTLCGWGGIWKKKRTETNFNNLVLGFDFQPTYLMWNFVDNFEIVH